MVGASLAGASAAQALRRQGFEGQVTLVGAEPHLPYERPPLSKQLLSGKWERHRIDLPLDASLEVDLRLATTVTAVDLSAHQLALEPTGRGVPVRDTRGAKTVERQVLGFDGLVICTGAQPRVLPRLPGDLEGVHFLRTVEDCLAIRQELAASPRVVVVGAGFIGSEVAATCRTLGLDVTIVEPLPTPMARVLGEEMGQVMAGLHRDHGTRLRVGAGVVGLEGKRRVEGVRIGNGEVVDADLVVIGVGVSPSTGWLEGSGLRLDDGVVCDATCAAVGAGDVVAAGDVARWYHPLFGRDLRLEHWDNAARQAAAAANTLLAGPARARPYAEVPWFWSDQYDTRLQFVGLAQPGDQVVVVEGNPAERRFVAVYGREGRTVGALVCNRSSRAGAYRQLIADLASFPPRPE